MHQKIRNIKFSNSLAKVFAIVTIAVLSGCMGVKNSTGNSAKTLFETFFVGEDGTQYFIKPLTFEGENKNRLKVDITFRYKDRIKDSAVVNISFLNAEIYRSIDSLRMTNDSVSVVLKDFKYLFAERMQKEFNSRFSTKGALADINKLFDKNDWVLIVYKQNKQSIYNTPNDTKKKIDKLKYGIFMLF